ncbi:hypothetical protein SAY86_011574 [Trapa natans]|uniref:BP28 C-terminal domain-containing protein n=1 Tax=Trapa natans TaxID=22666 RepID=A0AAN7R589_TRANT|nr:hypothetical protein SAY86_011574 [Trapa natans]
MATSISLQLNAIKSLVQAEPLNRSFIRASILFNSKEAADVDIDSIYTIALSGLEVLASTDERFDNYKSNLFSHRSTTLDRELMTPEENDRLDASINSYLRLLSGRFQLPSALKTLEYLLRRYKIHVYNTEELMLCALPYHGSHAFVRIAQLVNFGNTKWKFLEAVKVSGAPPPRQVIVQQCMRDLSVLEALCNYAKSTKKFYPSSHALGFCTAVIVEVLGSLPAVENEVVNKILPFVSSGFEIGRRKDSEHKAGSLMIVSLLASKAALSPKLVKGLVRSLAETAQDDVETSSDQYLTRLSVIALIHLTQTQSLDAFPMKALASLTKIRDINGIFLGLSKEFNIDKFLAVLLESLVEHSPSDELCYRLLISMIELIPLGDIIDCVISKIMFSFMKISKKKIDMPSSELGSCIKNILVAIKKNYPSKLREAIREFMENTGKHPGQQVGLGSLYNLLDENLDSALLTLDSKTWFSLNHPKPQIRRAALIELNNSDILKAKTADPQGFVTVQDAILNQLHDDDLTVVQAALSLVDRSEALAGAHFLEAVGSVLQRCMHIFFSSSDNSALTGDIIMLCFKHVIARLSPDSSNEFAAMIFPLLLITPKTWKHNIKALEFAKKLNCAIYQNLPDSCSVEKKLEPESISRMNQEIVESLADMFLMHTQEFLPLILKSSSDFMLSRTLFFLVLVQSFAFSKRENIKFFEHFDACFPVLKTQWQAISSSAFIHIGEAKMFAGDCAGFLDQLFDANIEELNAKILICIFWKLLDAFISVAPPDSLSSQHEKWFGKLQDFFSFLSGASKTQALKDHLHYLVTKYKSSPSLLAGFFTQDVAVPVQVQSLHCFAFLCSQTEDLFSLQLLAEAPSILVPLTSANQEVRKAAMDCMEGLHLLCTRIDLSSKKNDNAANWSYFLEELLGMIVQQKRLIISDREFLSTYLTSAVSLSGCNNSTLVPRNTEIRFNESVKEKILEFILSCALKLSSYGKLMIFSLVKGIGNALVHVQAVELLLSSLMNRREQCYFKMDGKFQGLSKYEVDILCLLLESCATTSIDGKYILQDHLLKALQLPMCSGDDPAVIFPCIVVLKKLNCQIYSELRAEMQELLLHELVLLVRCMHADIQNATKEALLRLEVPVSIMEKMLCQLSKLNVHQILQERQKKKKSKENKQQNLQSTAGAKTLAFVDSLLDILLIKKDISNREKLIGPLFKLLQVFFSIKCDLAPNEGLAKACSVTSEITTTIVCHIQQTITLVLEDIILSSSSAITSKEKILNEINIGLLLECLRLDQAGVVCDHIFPLLSTIARVLPEAFVNNMSEVLLIVGKSALTESHCHSQNVFESLISSIVPFWLSRATNMEQILQVFVNILPEVSAKRSLSFIMHLLRILGEHDSLASLLSLLFRSLITRRDLAQSGNSVVSPSEFMLAVGEWEYVFALQIIEHYSSIVWIPSLVMLLERIEGRSFSRDLFMELLLSVHLISQKLQDPELSMNLNTEQNSEDIQGTIAQLMKQLVSLLCHVDANKKIVYPSFRCFLKETMHSLLLDITKAMTPSSYFNGMIKLLDSKDDDVRKKALGLLSKTMKDRDSENLGSKSRRVLSLNRNRNWSQLDGDALESFNQMCLEIVHLIDASEENSDTSLKLAAVSAIEVLVSKFPSGYSIFSSCLAAISRKVCSDRMEISSGCLRAAGSLINVIGQKALVHLPCLMENLVQTTDSKPLGFPGKDNAASTNKLFSVLICLEAVVCHLGSFLTPYLDNICQFLVLHLELMSGSDEKLKSKAETVQNLIAEKIPVRLVFPSLMKLYSTALLSGDSSLNITFKILARVVCSMDRSSVGAYHARIYDLCLNALDLRRQCPLSVKNIGIIEESVVTSIISLTMKLTETMFKPLFMRTVEWAELEIDDSPHDGSRLNIDRAIPFYLLVNKLAEKHRSLFVPYFKYLLGSSVSLLTDSNEVPNSGWARKKKKARVSAYGDSTCNILSCEKWHIRALIVSAFQKCFLYDTGSLKFLDSSNFEALLKPIVSQLIIEPPADLEDHHNVPSVEEVDNLIVTCIGQMAVAAGSDLLWKPLNHEVLMQTRSEKVRARMLGLRIIQYLIHNLKEEYLVFLAETIPFLGELLEDVELTVKTLAQDILKEMESLSGESLRQYL